MSVDELIEKNGDKEVRCIEEMVFNPQYSCLTLVNILPRRVQASLQFASAAVEINLDDIRNPMNISYENTFGGKLKKISDSAAGFVSKTFKLPHIVAYSIFPTAFVSGLVGFKYSQRDGGYSFVDRDNQEVRSIKLAG